MKEFSVMSDHIDDKLYLIEYKYIDDLIDSLIEVRNDRC